MRSVPEPSSVGGGAGRDPWAGFGAGPPSGGLSPRAGANGTRDPGDERAVADLARRLQDRVDGQEALLDRIAELLAYPDDRARMAELRDVAHRIRRDSEALLLLCGADPGVHRGAPHTVSAVLGDAVGMADEPSRVVVRPVPAATLATSAAVELRHLVAELVDEAAAASPGARIEVGGRLEPGGALVVDVVIAGRGWTDAPGGARRGAFGAPFRLAERLAQRSSGGIRLDRPVLDQVEGLVATLRCPAALVTGQSGGDPWQMSSTATSSFLAQGPGAHAGGVPPGGYPGGPANGLDAYGAGRSGDELFGPLPTALGTVATPIFEAVASAWFRDDERGPATNDWNSPGDREWRAAAAAASRESVPTTTASGLPRRSPGDRLVPPPRAAQAPTPPEEQRVPERVRDRLATYQRGLRQGRHRAADPVHADPVQTDPANGSAEAWSVEGW